MTRIHAGRHTAQIDGDFVALRRVDLEAHFTSALRRRAAAHLGDHLTAPAEGIDPADYELQALVAELALRADREPATAATLEVQTRQLEVARLDREIAAARAEGRTDVSTLARERSQVLDELSAAMDNGPQGWCLDINADNCTVQGLVINSARFNRPGMAA